MLSISIHQAASAVIFDQVGRILLIQRGKQPNQGLWSLPGGSHEPGETIEATAVREVFEETGLNVTVTDRLWIQHVRLEDGTAFDIHVFHAELLQPTTPVAADDAMDAQWVDQAMLHRLPLTDGLLQALLGQPVFRNRSR